MSVKKQGVNGKVEETEILELMYGEEEVQQKVTENIVLEYYQRDFPYVRSADYRNKKKIVP